MSHPVVDLRKKQPWLMVPKAALDALDDPYLGYPGDLPVKEAGDEILRLTESYLAKVLLGQGHALGMLYGYRREVERRTKEEAFREGIRFALNVLRRFANSPMTRRTRGRTRPPPSGDSSCSSASRAAASVAATCA